MCRTWSETPKTGFLASRLTGRQTRYKQKSKQSQKLPTYRAMVTAVLENVTLPFGLSFEMILFRILCKNKICDTAKARRYLKSSLTKGVNTGYFKTIKTLKGAISYILGNSKTLKNTTRISTSRKESKKSKNVSGAPKNQNRIDDRQRLNEKTRGTKSTPDVLTKSCSPGISTSIDVRTGRKKNNLLKCEPLERSSSLVSAGTGTNPKQK